MDLQRIEEDFLIIPTLAKNQRGEVFYEIFTVPIEGLGVQFEGLGELTTTSLLRPKVVLKCLKFFHKLCVVGSVVYLFSEETSVATLDLSSFLRHSDQEEVVLKDDMIRYISPMKCEKGCVEAVPTPSRKVLAFSRSISLRSCFELYDPNTDTWEDVPEIEQQRLSPLGEIKSYYFIDNYTFVVHARNEKTYKLHIERQTNKSWWEDCGWSDCSSPLSGFPRAILGSGFELCLGDNVVWDIKNAGEIHKAVSRFPSSALHPPSKPKSRMIISWGRWSRCYVLEITIHSGQWYLSIQEYHLELAEYFKEKKAFEAEFGQSSLEKGSLELTMLVNRMKLTSPVLEWVPVRKSTFYIGRYHRLEDATTFSI